MSGLPEWRIDPLTLRLEGDAGNLSWAEFQDRKRPPCPVCGNPVHIRAVETKTMAEQERRYIAGRWECMQGCDPRSVSEAADLG